MRHLGFTLVELLVAIAIFAVLSALGWKVFDHIVMTKDQNIVHEQRLDQLQQTYQQILRDTVQLVPLTSNLNVEIRPALVLQNNKISFSKSGVTDPLQQGIAPDERVEYLYRQDEQKLYRLRYQNLNQSGREQPDSSVMLDQVERFSVEVLNPNSLTEWPEPSANSEDLIAKQKLPRGIKINLVINQVEYEWLFSLLNTEFLEAKQGAQP
ncbi:type II secretion system protein GspJ [Acinetobacter sp. NCu2D-2]|uniref:type II secretion system minor pseudopilin GspJ n=1 Tax=Acinetobacter sp. NCu2D-2 TaxID=1608473 RepID=UPI0007CDB8D1|nr:type II secretion system minor pseudopilin GspJ [Acinetobacter sp. NCu2D-2]ANF81977.1 type II secretion system protein GspJ [Acinetobacter sp. NCu2D-2]